MSEIKPRVGEHLSTWFKHGGQYHNWNKDQERIEPPCGGQAGKHYCLTWVVYQFEIFS